MMKLGLLGNKITHSLSPLIFERLFDLHEVQGLTHCLNVTNSAQKP